MDTLNILYIFVDEMPSYHQNRESHTKINKISYPQNNFIDYYRYYVTNIFNDTSNDYIMTDHISSDNKLMSSTESDGQKESYLTKSVGMFVGPILPFIIP